MCAGEVGTVPAAGIFCYCLPYIIYRVFLTDELVFLIHFYSLVFFHLTLPFGIGSLLDKPTAPYLRTIYRQGGHHQRHFYFSFFLFSKVVY